MSESAASKRCLDGVTICFVSTAGFGGTWRTHKQARTLSASGARVVVAGYEDLVPRAFRDSGFEVVLVSRLAAPTLPVARSSSNPVWAIRVAMNLTFNAWLNRRLRPPVPVKSARDLHGRLLEAVVGVRPDIVQAGDPAALGVVVEAAKRTGARVVYDSREYWAGFVNNPDMKMDDAAARFRLEEERTGIARADLVTVTSDVMGEWLVRRYGIAAPLTLYNSPPNRIREPRPVHDRVRLVFHGGLSKDRNLEALVEAMRLLRGRATLSIYGYDRTATGSEIQALVEELQLRDSVSLCGPFEYANVVNILLDYDIGVMANRIVDENFEVTLPNKLFDCMCAGLAVAMTGSEAVRRLLDEVPYGATLDPTSPESVATDLGALIDSPDRIMRMKQAAVEAASRYWWPEQGRKLVSAFEDVLGGN